MCIHWTVGRSPLSLLFRWLHLKIRWKKESSKGQTFRFTASCVPFAAKEQCEDNWRSRKSDLGILQQKWSRVGVKSNHMKQYDKYEYIDIELIYIDTLEIGDERMSEICHPLNDFNPARSFNHTHWAFIKAEVTQVNDPPDSQALWYHSISSSQSLSRKCQISRFHWHVPSCCLLYILVQECSGSCLVQISVRAKKTYLKDPSSGRLKKQGKSGTQQIPEGGKRWILFDFPFETQCHSIGMLSSVEDL